MRLAIVREARPCRIRAATTADQAGAYRVCLETGDDGGNATALHAADPDALGRIYVGPYLLFEPELSLVLEDDEGICGYALGALDSRHFYDRYEREWRPRLCAQFPEPAGERRDWSLTDEVHYEYHHPTYFCPAPYERFPSHLHIDLLPRAQGRGYGRQLMERNLATLRTLGSSGAHLAVSLRNPRAVSFYRHLGFRELTTEGCIYLGLELK
jgi:ribosomal protein S18 acetylase RimI-like enzyme